MSELGPVKGNCAAIVRRVMTMPIVAESFGGVVVERIGSMLIYLARVFPIVISV